MSEVGRVVGGEIVVVVIVVVVIVVWGRKTHTRDRRGEGDRASPDVVMISLRVCTSFTPAFRITTTSN